MTGMEGPGLAPRAEIPARMPATRKLASMADLPEERKGEVTPDSGSRPSTPPLISAVSRASSSVRPRARKKP